MLALTGVGFRGYHGLGAYTCPTGVCVPSDGTTSTVFRRLQAAANEAGEFLGNGGPVGQTIAVDGKIGPLTAAKVYTISVAMPDRPDLAFLTTMSSQTTAGAIAANANRVIEELEAVVSGEIQMPTHELAPIDPYATVPPQTPVATSPTVPGAGPHITTSATTRFKAPPLAAKIALGAIGLGLVVLLVRSRRRRAAPMAGTRRRRR